MEPQGDELDYVVSDGLLGMRFTYSLFAPHAAQQEEAGSTAASRRQLQATPPLFATSRRV